MNVSNFFEHWGITENPFRAEEARHDAVFERLGLGPTTHPDFEKILGEPGRPATSIVFGEKGSGKTATRLQIAKRLVRYNEVNPDAKTLLVAYDDLNPILDRFFASVSGSADRDRPRKKRRGRDTGDGESSELRRLRKLRLVDHMDAILHIATTGLVDALLGDPRADRDIHLGADAAREIRRAPATIRRDLMVLQACYDRPDHADDRTLALRRRIRGPVDRLSMLWSALAFGGWIIPGVVVAAWFLERDALTQSAWQFVFFGALAIWAVFLAKRFLWDRWRLSQLARRVSRQIRVLNRPSASLARSLGALTKADRAAGQIPTDGADDERYAMFARLRRVISVFGYTGMMVIIDRIDEPTLVSGDPDRMQAVIWPLLNNKFLQMERTGFKLLLPIELRHSLFRESTAFFQEARLDKQNLVERLTWTGPTLYDLCNARLQACRAGDNGAISLVDLFEDTVTRQDIVDALDQMHQPRDAFKFLYQCIQEHCSNVTQEQAAWVIPRLVLETVRKQQSDRVQQFYRGVRPA